MKCVSEMKMDTYHDTKPFCDYFSNISSYIYIYFFWLYLLKSEQIFLFYKTSYISQILNILFT